MPASSEPRRLRPEELTSAIASSRFLEAVSRNEARKFLICSIGTSPNADSPGDNSLTEIVAVSDRTSPAALAEIGARMNVEFESVLAADAEIRALIERVYDNPVST